MDEAIGKNAVEEAEAREPAYTRFTLSQRIEHFVLLVSFTLLGITGLAQKYATSQAGAFTLAVFGGIESSRVVHRTSAVVLMVVSIYHILAVGYRIYVLKSPLNMLPVLEDFQHLYDDILFYLGRRKRKAYYGRYNYAEKVEYLAVVWGTIIMAITGFMMWNPIATTNLLPGEAIPAAKAAHGGEALLAVLAIILWHFYHVHIRHFNKSMFTGKMTEEEMLEEHPAELARIKAGEAHQRPPEAEIRRRQRYYLPVAFVLTAVMSYALVLFITFEETAIATVPQGETAPVFVPITPTPTITPPPTQTPPPGQALTWEGAVGPLLQSRCGACHTPSGLGGLNLTTYQGVLAGGDSGLAVVPGDPEASLLVQIQQQLDHPGQLNDDELARVIQWIEAGAPE